MSSITGHAREGGLMFERYTVKARQAVDQGAVEARRLGSGYIATEQLLLGVVHDSACFAVRDGLEDL